jgi:hypothetical protein
MNLVSVSNGLAVTIPVGHDYAHSEGTTSYESIVNMLPEDRALLDPPVFMLADPTSADAGSEELSRTLSVENDLPVWIVTYGEAAPVRHLLPKSVVQERINAIGKLGDVLTVLNSQPIFFARWFAPDWPNVYFDDEALLAILAGVGCTPAEIETITGL